MHLHRVPGEPIVLAAYGMQELHADSWEPQAPSMFLRGAEADQAVPDQARLRLEYRSGDCIPLVAAQFKLTPDLGGTPTDRPGIVASTDRRPDVPRRSRSPRDQDGVTLNVQCQSAL